VCVRVRVCVCVCVCVCVRVCVCVLKRICHASKSGKHICPDDVNMPKAKLQT